MDFKEFREPIVLQSNGQKIFGVMHRPDTTANYPAVLMCHGLGGNKIGKGRLYVNLAERLAKNGIATLRIDFRGSGDSEGEFSSMTIDSEVSDALVALDYLKNDSQVDATRIALFGRSLGGVVAILAAERSNCIKSLALWAPVFGCDQWKEKWAKVHSASLSLEQKSCLLEVEGLRPGYHFFEQLFSLKLNDSLSKLSHIPLLHIHGEADSVVDLSHANLYKEARHQASGKTQFKLLPKSDHDFTDFNERHEALEETAKWFTATL